MRPKSLAIIRRRLFARSTTIPAAKLNLAAARERRDVPPLRHRACHVAHEKRHRDEGKCVARGRHGLPQPEEPKVAVFVKGMMGRSHGEALLSCLKVPGMTHVNFNPGHGRGAAFR
jgi:hypothetical protein